MRQDERPLDSYRDLTGLARKYADELVKLKKQIARARVHRDTLLGLCLSPDMEGAKLMSYRLAAELSGVPHETLRRWFGG